MVYFLHSANVHFLHAKALLSGQHHPQLSQVRRGRQHAHHQGHGGLRCSALLLFLQPASHSQKQRQCVRRPRADHLSTRLRVLVSARRPLRSDAYRSSTTGAYAHCVESQCEGNATSTSTQNQTRHAERSHWTAISRLLLQHPSSSMGRPRLAHAVAPHTRKLLTSSSDTRDP